MTRKTGTKWKTSLCGRCGEAHSGYSGKLDAQGIEYVVCGKTHKRMNIGNDGNIRDIVFRLAPWEKDR